MDVVLIVSHKNKNFTIFSDSLSALQCLTSTKTYSKLNENSYYENSVKVTYAPFHTRIFEIFGNKEVDKLARSASISESVRYQTSSFP